MQVIILVDLRDANDAVLQTIEIDPEMFSADEMIVIRNSLMRSLVFYREGGPHDAATPKVDTPPVHPASFVSLG